MKILMTGSHGFVGMNLIEAFSGEHEIIRWDVRSNQSFPNVDAVIHLAGKAHDTKKTTEACKYFEVNTELTKRVYDRFLGSSAKKFIFFSSIKAKDGDTPYALSKKAAEDYILGKFRDKNIGFRDKAVYILRPCMIHGKGVKGNLPLLFKTVSKGLPWPLATFENQRSYASMGNVSYIVNKLLEKDVKSDIYNVCDDETVSTNMLIRLMGECLCRKVKMLRIPKVLACVGARIGDVLHLPLNTERLRKLTEDYIVDNSEIKRALGIEKLPVSASDGLHQTIMSMIKDNWNV